MKKISLKQVGLLFLIIPVISLVFSQPLWAVEEDPAPQVKEESFFGKIKRKMQEWTNGDNHTEKAPVEAPEQAEETPQEPAPKQSEQKSEGRKAIDTFKKEMNKITDNMSESFERDREHLKKKLEKSQDEK